MKGIRWLVFLLSLSLSSVALAQLEFEVDPTSVSVGDTVTVSLVGSIAGVLEWGDGTQDNVDTSSTGEAEFSHRYQAPGSYTVQLTDDAGNPLGRGTQESVTVRAGGELDASTTAPLVNESVRFTASNLSRGSSYRLDFGDGESESFDATAAEVTLSHAYTQAGTVMAQLHSVLADGSTTLLDRLQLTVEAAEVSLELDPETARVNETVTARIAGLPAGSDARLDWGDGMLVPVTQDGSVSHEYLAPGVYVAELSLVGGAAAARATVTVSLSGSLEASPADPFVNQAVSFSASDLVAGLEYQLDFGDGESVTFTAPASGEVSQSHRYAEATAFVATLSANLEGTSERLDSVTLSVRPLDIEMSVEPEEAAVGEEVTATLSGLPGGFSGTLDWADGEVDAVTNDGNYTHTFSAPGTFLVNLTDAAGNSLARATVRVSIEAEMTVEPEEAAVGEAVTATLSGLPGSFDGTLDWGDGSSDAVSANGAYTHSFSSPGTFVVTLTDAAGNLLARATVEVSLTGELDADPLDPFVGQTVSFTASNLSPDVDYRVDFGDGESWTFTASTDVANSTHTYAQANPAVVVQLFAELATGSQLFDSLTLSVQMPEIDLSVEPSAIILGESVTASVSGLTAGQSATLDWGDAQSDLVTGDGDYTHSYNEVGIETVELVHEGLVVARATVTVSLSGALDADPETFVPGESVSFSATELSAGYEHRLDFGDGSSETFTAPESGTVTIEHIYPADLTEPAVLAQLSILLPNEESLLDTVSLRAVPAEAEESLSHELSEVPANEIRVDITAEGLLEGADYLIDFGDGSQDVLSAVATSEAVQHSYASEAVYAVQLFLQSPSGQILQATDTVQAQWARGDESLSVVTSSPKVDEVTEFLAEDLITVYSYDIAFGGLQANQTPPFTGVSEQTVDNVYSETGTYNAQLYVTYPDGLREPRDTAFVTVDGEFVLTDLDWSFSGESTLSDDDFSGSSETVQLDEAGLTVMLEYDYEGSGVLEATVEREGEVVETISQTLYGFSQGDSYTSLPLATDQEGVYTLSLSVLNPEGVYALTPLTYIVSDIGRLAFGDFVVRVTDIDNPDPSSFSGAGVLEDFVFAGRLQTVPVEVSFSNLTLKRGYQGNDDLWEVLVGEAVQAVDNTVLLSLPASLTGVSVQLQGMTLEPTGADISGVIFLPFVQGGIGGFQSESAAASVEPVDEAGGLFDGYGASGVSAQSNGTWQQVPLQQFLDIPAASSADDSHDAYANMEVSYLLGENQEVLSEPILLYDGVPVSSPFLANKLVQPLLEPDQQTDVFVNPTTLPLVNRIAFTDQPLDASGNFVYSGVSELEEPIRIVEGKVVDVPAGQRTVIVDFSKSQNPDQAALNRAYAAWETPNTPEAPTFGLTFDTPEPDAPTGLSSETPAPPPSATPIEGIAVPGGVATAHTSPGWMGLVLTDAPVSYTTTDNQTNEVITDVAWVAQGFQTFFAASAINELTTVGAWEVALKSETVAVKNSQLLGAIRIGTVHLDFFDEAMWVKLSQTATGSTLRSIAPIWHKYGNTVLFAYNAQFVGNKLVFPDAYWGFNADLSAPEPPPGTFSEGPGGIGMADSFVLASINGYSGASWGEITFLQANYEHQIRIPQLSLYANGSADLNGTSERSINDAPNLTFMDYPFLNGSGTVTLTESGGAYALGVAGGLELADNMGTTNAFMNYQFQNGQQQSWDVDADPMQPEVNGVTFDFDEIEGELDLSGNDLSFAASGEIPLEHLGFKVGVSGAFGRKNAVRYWYVSSEFSSGGAAPIVDTGGGVGGQLAFWSFGGGASHNLTTSLDVTGNETCSFLSWKDQPENAKSCVNSSNPWAFYAETVISPTESYGGDETVHVHGLLEVSAQGSFNLLGRAWFLRSFADGYDAGATPQAAVHVGIDTSRFVMTACVGQNSSPIGAPEGSQSLDCTGLAKMTFPQSVPIIEYRGWGQLLADWQNSHYYLAVGNYDNRISASFFDLAFKEGYLMLGAGLPSSWLPPNANEGSDVAFYTGRKQGVNWDFEHKWGILCERRVWAKVDIGNELNLLLELSPFAMGADVAYWAEAGAGYDGCIIAVGVMIAGEVHGSVYVSQAYGDLNGSFSGSVKVKKVFGSGWNTLIDVNKSIEITLWGG